MVLPKEAEEISFLLKLANQERFPVIPRGAGTATTGAPLAHRGGVVVSLTKLDRILEINREDLVAVVEPGVTNGEFRKEVEKRGLFYPPDPASLEFSTLGGNVATCAGGPKGLKYGVTKDYVLGLEVVLPQGEILFLGRRTIKGVVGYDLVHLFTGSEGTLGIITKIVLKLLPKPPFLATLLAAFPSVVEAAQGFSALLNAGLLPTTAELLDEVTLKAVSSFLEEEIGAKSLLLLEFDGGEAQVREDLEKAQKTLKGKALWLKTAASEEERKKLWTARRSVSPALKRLANGKISDDVVIPRGRLPRFLEEAKKEGERFGLLVACFGHIGDGNVHVNILFQKEDETEKKKAQSLREIILEKALALEGTISGEHGIGLTKKAYLPREIPPKGLELMRGIKKVFDPLGIMNPGKVFP